MRHQRLAKKREGGPALILATPAQMKGLAPTIVNDWPAP